MGKLSWVKRACGVLLLCTTAAVALPAQTLTTLHSFSGTDGSAPIAGLVRATDGNLYGTTPLGGVNNLGTVFKTSAGGTLNTIYSFNGTDGGNPLAGLIQATDGNFYGTTQLGGSNNLGTVFKITPSARLSTLHSFNGTDGENPVAGLVEARIGKLYGTTQLGGSNNLGTVFKITLNGTLTSLDSFNGTDGENPVAGLVPDLVNLGLDMYGSTGTGGANGQGTVFKLTNSRELITIHSFCLDSGCPDGSQPEGLVEATTGTLFGTTTDGGANLQGTFFKLTPSGSFKSLYNFCSQPNCTDGEAPRAGLIQGTDGNFYGTTYGGGSHGKGTVFKVTPSGTLTTLYSFGTQVGDGAGPSAALIQDTNGEFYGTTVGGGANGDGTVFGLSVGLDFFVEAQPTSGTVGTAVTILGTSMTGATRVTFNGTVATFTVVSESEITTVVPTGATTGKVQVLTPTRMLKSYVPFTVTP